MRLSFKDALRKLAGIPAVTKRFEHHQSFQPEVRAWLAENPKENEMVGDLHHVNAGRKVQAEMDRQNRMWGIGRDDHTKGELMYAAMSQLEAVALRQDGEADAFNEPSHLYPENWSGFRDYGSDVANLVVAAAWIQQEIARKLRAGEDDTRLSRNHETQPYIEGQGVPTVQLP